MVQHTIVRCIINIIKESNPVLPSIEFKLCILIHKTHLYEIIKNNADGIYQYMGGMILLEFH